MEIYGEGWGGDGSVWRSLHSDREFGEERNVLEWGFLDESQGDDTAARRTL